MTPAQRRVLERALDEFARVLAHDAMEARNSLSRFDGPGRPLRWDAATWKQGDYEWWRRHRRAARALDAAIDAVAAPATRDLRRP